MCCCAPAEFHSKFHFSFTWLGTKRSEDGRIVIEIRRNRTFDRVAISKTRIINRRNSVANITSRKMVNDREYRNGFEPGKNNPFKLKGRRKSLHGASRNTPSAEIEPSFATSNTAAPEKSTAPAKNAAPANDLSQSIMLVDTEKCVKSAVPDNGCHPLLEFIGFDGQDLPINVVGGSILTPIVVGSSNTTQKRPLPELIPINPFSRKMETCPAESSRGISIQKPNNSKSGESSFKVAHFILEKIGYDFCLNKKVQPSNSTMSEIEFDDSFGTLHYSDSE